MTPEIDCTNPTRALSNVTKGKTTMIDSTPPAKDDIYEAIDRLPEAQRERAA